MLPARVGRYTVVALDTAGNRSRVAATITIVHPKVKGAKPSLAVRP